tara:strand:- start:1961 stop:2143 length:183 start_codon:yes stop_codon:yes gene_type:complete
VDDCIKVIDDLVQREVEWADESTEELQDAWLNLRKTLVDITVLLNKIDRDIYQKGENRGG